MARPIELEGSADRRAPAHRPCAHGRPRTTTSHVDRHPLAWLRSAAVSQIEDVRARRAGLPGNFRRPTRLSSTMPMLGHPT
eukprot:3704053-Prymnesium_polylepis.1